MTILTRLRHAAEQCRYWRRRRQISQYSTTNGLFSGTSGGVCLHVSRPRGRPEARGRGPHEGGALAQRPASHHHALRPEAARPPHPQAGAWYLPAECYSPPRPAQHYYPEGGWGWCVAMASVLVNILAHGLQVTQKHSEDITHDTADNSSPSRSCSCTR